MRSSCTSCAHTKTFHLGYPPKAPDNKLEFVEHVLGVLIESRFGTGDPYSRLGEPPVTTGHSQMFPNVRLLSTAEIEAHLSVAEADRVPFYVACLRENHLRKRVVIHGGDTTLINELDYASAQIFAELKPPAHAGGSPSRGSPTFSGTLVFASFFANLANLV